jgi:hypothetical protein
MAAPLPARRAGDEGDLALKLSHDLSFLRDLAPYWLAVAKILACVGSVYLPSAFPSGCVR